MDSVVSADRTIRVTYGSREKRGECDKLEVDCEEGERIKTINGEGGGASHSSVWLSLFIRLYQLTGALLRGGDLLILATYDHHSQDHYYWKDYTFDSKTGPKNHYY